MEAKPQSRACRRVTHTGPEREHDSERVFGAMLLGDLTLFSRVPSPLFNLSQVQASMTSTFMVEASVEMSSSTPAGPSQGEEVGLLGSLAPLVWGMGGGWNTFGNGK